MTMRLEYQSGLTASVLNSVNLLGMTFDGTHYYLPQPESRSVLKLDRDLAVVSTIKTKRRFCLLYWEQEKGQFWAAGDTPFKLYRLNKKLEIKETITVCLPYQHCLVLRGIGVDCDSGNLVLTTSTGVYEVDRGGCFVNRLLHASADSELLYVLVVAPYMVIYYCRGGKTYLALAERCGKIVEETVLPRSVALGAIMFDPSSSCDNPIIHVALTRGNVASIVEHELGVCVAPCNVASDVAGISSGSCCCLVTNAAADILNAISCINSSLACLLVEACCSDDEVAGATDCGCSCGCQDGCGCHNSCGCGDVAGCYDHGCYDPCHGPCNVCGCANGCNCGNSCGCGEVGGATSCDNACLDSLNEMEQELMCKLETVREMIDKQNTACDNSNNCCNNCGCGNCNCGCTGIVPL